ncbi:hypothetical protein P343_08005 [Sporolactobacillus laevolacticus DSM 442]|uniref:Uncharacterized protein n=1 Tax=Sporolactobacillus laevolacticus DSM 442 TaxID=1395513 RepID=V6IXI2_9BACL|nr:hypothetical protein P343_08005 [Sporolactobacillus laevolacticus DSM 442]
MLAIENENKRSQKDLLQHEIEVLAGIATSKDKYRKIVQAGIARWVKDFQKGQIKIDTVDDLKKLIEIDLQLQKDEL